MTNKPSLIWKFFTVDAVEKQKARCNICQAVILRGPPNNPSHYSTSPLFKHLKYKHPADHELAKIDGRQLNGDKAEPCAAGAAAAPESKPRSAQSSSPPSQCSAANRERNRGGRNKDPIWGHFRRVTNAAGILKAECTLCQHQQAPVAKRLKRHMVHAHAALLCASAFPYALSQVDHSASASASAFDPDDELDDDDDADDDDAKDDVYDLKAQQPRRLQLPPSQAHRAPPSLALDVVFAGADVDADFDAKEEPEPSGQSQSAYASAASLPDAHTQLQHAFVQLPAAATASATASVASQSTFGMFCDVLVQEELVVRAAICRSAAATLIRRDVLDELSARARPGVDSVCRQVALASAGAPNWPDAAAAGTAGGVGGGASGSVVTATGRTALKLELFQRLGGFTEVFVCEQQQKTHEAGVGFGVGDGDVEDALPCALVLGRPFLDAYLEEELEEDADEQGAGLSIGPRILLVGTEPRRKSIRLSSASCYMG